MRTATITRKTAETEIALTLCLEGGGGSSIATGVGFLDHMLTLFASHGRFGLTVACRGDTDVDDHHTVEDIGIALGAAFAQALGDKAGITRYGSVTLPMDESLVLCAVDLSGRCTLAYEVPTAVEKIGAFDVELAEEFWLGFARAAAATVHIHRLAGSNAHHLIEASFKGMGRALRAAVAIDPSAGGAVPSTKGVL